MEGNGLLQTDHSEHFLPKKQNSVELGTQSDSNFYTVGTVDIKPSSTEGTIVELGDQKVLKAIRKSVITSEHNCHTTIFFDSERSPLNRPLHHY